MIKFPFVEKHMFGNISCSDDQFGNVARDTTKQCFCATEMPTQKVERCGLERNRDVCTGHGTVYFGSEVISGVSPAPFDAMIRSGKFVKKDVKGSINCDSRDFGSDPHPGHLKQCFFEAKAAKRTVKKCAEQGGECQCNGNIFYGASLNYENKTLTKFNDIFTMPFKYQSSNGSKPVKCSNKALAEDDDNFLSGIPKECWCDDIEKVSSRQINTMT